MGTSREETRVVAGRYRLRSVLGSGSMGTVWSAYDEFLHRQVAVKEVRLPPGVPVTQADELRERTLREARAIAVLSHPNVIILHDVVRENGEPFVVMELLPSRSLAHILRDHGPLGVEQAAAVGIAIAAALEAAHAAGITHRDVKPGNVLVAADGRIKLTDFGIARNVSEATMTRTGMMLGSPAYIAPEVASGGAVTTGADLWGLGATLFALIEGHPPYDADGDPLETVGTVVNGDVPKPAPGPLAEVIGALMDKEPTARISLREVRQRLHPLQPKTPHDLFGPELFHTPDGTRTSAQLDATDTQIITTVSPAPKKSTTGFPLAPDPGPLPFMTLPAAPAAPPVAAAPSARPQARPVPAKIVLATIAVLLFAAAAGGGFALARTVGGQPIRPPRPGGTPALSAAATTTVPMLVSQQGDATSLNGIKGGLFTLDVPAGWARFVTQQPAGKPSPSTLVQFVSPDGRQSIGVQRYADYFAKRLSEDDFVKALATPGASSTTFFMGDNAPLTDGRQGRRLTYRTVEHAFVDIRPAADGSSNIASRTTFADVFKQGDNLWVVSVTVPVEQQGIGKAEVFDKIAPTFATSD